MTLGEGRGIFWGWYVVIGALCIMAINYGTRFIFGVFVAPMAEDLQWSRSAVSAGMLFLVLFHGIGGVLGPLVTGWLYDLRGSYSLAWWIQLAALLVATAMIFFLKRGPGPKGAVHG